MTPHVMPLQQPGKQNGDQTVLDDHKLVLYKIQEVTFNLSQGKTSLFKAFSMAFFFTQNYADQIISQC